MDLTSLFNSIFKRQINILHTIYGNEKYKEYALMNLHQAHYWTRELIKTYEDDKIKYPFTGTLDGGL